MPRSSPHHNLTSPRIAELFAIANDDPNASKRRRVHGKRVKPITEGERVAAVNELLREFRLQLAQLAEAKAPLASQGTMNEFPPLLAATPKGAKPASAKAVKVGSQQPRWPKRGKPVQVDPLLRQGIQDWGLRVFSKPNPVSALEKFLGVRRPPGKRAKNADRDLQIAVDVVKEMREKTSKNRWRKRMSVEKAAEMVAPKYGLEAERIQKIYKRHRVAAQAEVALLAEVSHS
jgi:hypothetical protein